MMTRKQINAAHTILIEECGALATDASAFIYNQERENYPEEYRFQGALGFGGKFRRRGERYFVTCYSEDRTPERDAMIEAANKRLADLAHENQT